MSALPPSRSEEPSPSQLGNLRAIGALGQVYPFAQAWLLPLTAKGQQICPALGQGQPLPSLSITGFYFQASS